MSTYGIKYVSFQANQEQSSSHDYKIVPLPNTGPIRCKAYLKKIAAVIIGIVAGIVLGIPVAAICLPGLPCMLSVYVQKRKDVSNTVKDIADGCMRLFFLPALPLLGLDKLGVIKATVFLIKDYPKELWQEADRALQRADRIDRRTASLSTSKSTNEKSPTSSRFPVGQHKEEDINF